MSDELIIYRKLHRADTKDMKSLADTLIILVSRLFLRLGDCIVNLLDYAIKKKQVYTVFRKEYGGKYHQHRSG